jgi:DNA-binding MarR family transcriptional regulator
LERILNSSEVQNLLEGGVLETNTSASGQTSESQHNLGPSFVHEYVKTQELCSKFSVPRQHSESVAILVLIDLFENAKPGLSVTEAGVILCIPGATTARKMRELTSAGLIEVQQDTADKRRFHPKLTDLGREFILQYESLRSENRNAVRDLALPAHRGKDLRLHIARLMFGNALVQQRSA